MIRTIIRYSGRENEGAYAAPLPPPAERRRIREAAGFTQEELAERIGVSRHSVRMYERPAGVPRRQATSRTGTLG
jgi:DNA-binding transcriptional regulator YiaG